MEADFLRASGLAMSETGVLFCILDHGLNLTAQAAVPNDLLGMLPSVS